MNNKDRERAMRLRKCIGSVPFPISGMGSRTATMAGYVAYANDMRAIMPAFKAVLYGMSCEQSNDWIAGEDVDDPDILLDAIELWLDMRNSQRWESANSQSFAKFKEDARSIMRSE